MGMLTGGRDLRPLRRKLCQQLIVSTKCLGEAGNGGANDSCDEGSWCSAIVDEGPRLE